MKAMGSKEAIHALIDELREDEIPAARRALERIRGNGHTDEVDGPSAYDKAKAASVIGCVEGPSDLATNPEYMADFGK